MPGSASNLMGLVSVSRFHDRRPSSGVFSVNSTIKTIIFWVLIIVGGITLFQVLKTVNSGQKEAEINLTQFNTKVDEGTVKQVDVTGMEVKGKLADNSTFHTTAPATYFTPELIKKTQDKGVRAPFPDATTAHSGSLFTT